VDTGRLGVGRRAARRALARALARGAGGGEDLRQVRSGRSLCADGGDRGAQRIRSAYGAAHAAFRRQTETAAPAASRSASKPTNGDARRSD
jgi:hypothetical protein